MDPALKTDLFAELTNKYAENKGAHALFFYSGSPHNWKALRLVSQEMNRQFTDNVYIGRDPSGYFYYNDIPSVDQAVYYYSQSMINPRNDRVCASVKFFNTENHDGTGTPIAEFLAYDPYENVSKAQMNGFGSTQRGEWKENTFNNGVEATITKSTNSGTVTLDSPKGANASVTITGTEMTSGLRATSLSVKGTLYYQDRNNLKNAKFVNYNNDRLVFYTNDYSGKDFEAFFFPFTDGDPVPKSLGLTDGIWVTLDAAWTVRVET